MDNRWISSLWMHRLLFLAVALFLIFIRLLPLPNSAGRLPGPDLLLCLICAWTVRRPEYLPVLMVAAVVLLEDMLLMRPPGLWTGLVILAAVPLYFVALALFGVRLRDLKRQTIAESHD